MVATDWPVLVSRSSKDFVGETLNAPVGERLIGTLAAMSISAWLAARAFRVHNVTETRRRLDMIASPQGAPRTGRTVRGLA